MYFVNLVKMECSGQCDLKNLYFNCDGATFQFANVHGILVAGSQTEPPGRMGNGLVGFLEV